MKPLDAGTGRLCASFDVDTAAWLSMGAPHERHGFVELSALDPFDETKRGNALATRRYRLDMTRAEHAFLIVMLDGAPPVLAADATDPIRPRWAGDGVVVEISADPDASVIRQRWEFEDDRRDVAVILQGRLDRPALAEITELDPPVPTGALTAITTDGAEARWASPSLPADASASVLGCAVAWHSTGSELVGTLTWPAGAMARSFTIEAGLRPLSPDGTRSSRFVATGDRLTDRALAYVRGCTALRVSAHERTILTDHRLLPLSWTRDAYWQALALLAADGPEDRERVADHLRWLWRRCERPDGRWVRSHHANGRRKDLAFQADQQLYPLVELTDYWRLTASLPEGVDWSSAVAAAWAAALEEIDPSTGLMASTENAADDPVAAPFIASSQILLWYTAQRVAEMAVAVGLKIDVAGIRATATAIRAAFDLHFGGDPWPYAVDGRSLRVAYHDANDLPVALAPLWGFCRATDPGWQATMAFAFSDANHGWSAGSRPGLGSAHTEGAWTLGDIQVWIHSLLMGDERAARASLARLEEVAFADGMLPEAYDADAHDRIRHWFAWPGAAFAALRLLDARGELRDRLVAGGSPSDTIA